VHSALLNYGYHTETLASLSPPTLAANQYEYNYSPKSLGNWEIPKDSETGVVRAKPPPQKKEQKPPTALYFQVPVDGARVVR
jgi:hypothetical protein